jgi:hypothetical protein
MNNGTATNGSRRIGVTKPTKYNRHTAYYFDPVTKKPVYIGTFGSADEAAQARWRFLQSLPSNVRSRIATNYVPQRSNYAAVTDTRKPYNYMLNQKDAPSASRPSAALSPPTVIAPTYNPFADMMNEEPASAAAAPAVPAGLDGGRRRRRASTRSRKLTLKTRRSRGRKHR